MSTHVHVLSDDACIRSTCVEILARLGFRATASPLDGTAETPPDVVLLWEREDGQDVLADARRAYDKVPIVFCTWDHRRPWQGADAVVSLPFNVERVASTVARMLKHRRTLAA
jgi:hypothetical protein